MTGPVMSHQLARLAVGAVAAGVLAAGQAQALGVRVNVGGQDWDVTTFTGGYNSNPANRSKFHMLSAGGVMPWWNDSSLAESFATAVGPSLNAPNFDGGCGVPRGCHPRPLLPATTFRISVPKGGKSGQAWESRNLVPPGDGELFGQHPVAPSRPLR